MAAQGDDRSETSSVFGLSTSTSPPRDSTVSSPLAISSSADAATANDAAHARRRKTAPASITTLDESHDSSDVDAKAAASAIARPIVNAARIITRGSIGSSSGSSGGGASRNSTVSAAVAATDGEDHAAAATDASRNRKGSVGSTAGAAAPPRTRTCAASM